MVKKIISVLLSAGLSVSIIGLGLVESYDTKKEVDYDTISELKDFKLKQAQAIIDVEIQKHKEAEAKRIAEEQRLKELEEQRQRELEAQKKPHFNPNDVTEPSNLSKEQIHKMLEGTALVTLVDAIYWYEQEYGVNGIFITSIIALESGWGSSYVARNYNNLSGYIGQNGDYYTFANWGESIQETFRLIGEEYVREDGLFYNGKSISAVNIRYCEVDSWTPKVTQIGYELLSKIN